MESRIWRLTVEGRREGRKQEVGWLRTGAARNIRGSLVVTVTERTDKRPNPFHKILCARLFKTSWREIRLRVRQTSIG